MSERQLVASSTVRRKRFRKRLPTTLVALAGVAAVGAALTAAVNPVPGLDFLPSGHWVFNAVTELAVHIDGGSPSVDASVSVRGAGPGSQVVQGPDTGYVIGKDKITVFGKSSLSVEQEIAPPSDETPVAIEALGGPYMFYRNAGKIVRLGDGQATISTNGPFADQVITPDGTVWVYKRDAGTLCPLGKDAAMIGSCPVTLERGHDGLLTVVGNQPEFLDTTADALYPLSDRGFGAGHGVGFQVSPDARLASSDVDGRVAILDPGTHQMHLINADEPARDPVLVTLSAKGDYTTPSSTGSAVALVDRKGGTVLTSDSHGAKRGEHVLPKNDGAPKVSKGEDNRIYVENGTGTDVVVVGEDGKLTEVPAAATPDADPSSSKAKPDPDADPVPGNSGSPERDERTTTPPSSSPPSSDTTDSSDSTHNGAEQARPTRRARQPAGRAVERRGDRGQRLGDGDLGRGREQRRDRHQLPGDVERRLEDRFGVDPVGDHRRPHQRDPLHVQCLRREPRRARPGRVGEAADAGRRGGRPHRDPLHSRHRPGHGQHRRNPHLEAAEPRGWHPAELPGDRDRVPVEDGHRRECGLLGSGPRTVL
jgi:hypothetical protein